MKIKIRKKINLTKILFGLTALIILTSLVYAGTTTPLGVFNISNVLPYAPYNWTPNTTHYKNQNFSWYQPTDANGDNITTYLCITNDTDTDSCSVVNTERGNGIYWYEFNQSESFWDYALFGTASRTYYVKLTPNDGLGNGTVNDTIYFTLTDAIPTITGQTSNASVQGDKKVGDTINFYMTSHGDTDIDDNHSLRICKTNSINTSGACLGGEYCNAYGTTFSNATDLSCTYVAQQSDNTSNFAYFFICDCPPYDLTCPGQCSNAYTSTFYVNHMPNVTNVDIKPDTPNSIQDLNCSYTFNDYDNDSDNSTFKWYNWSGSAWVLTAFTTQTLSANYTENGQTWMCEVTPIDYYGYTGTAVNSTNETINNAPPYQPSNFSVQDGETSYDYTDPYDTHDITPFINWTDGDPDGDPVTTLICVASSYANLIAGNCDINSTNTTATNITLSGLSYNGTSVLYYLRLTPNDGQYNGTYYDVNLTILNSFPNQPNNLSPTLTHNPTPTLTWNATDPDDGTVDHWPADNLTYYILVGTAYGDGSYENNSNANKSGELVNNPIPWGTPNGDYANTTAYVSIWTTDGNGGISPYYNTTLILYDYLPDITQVEMTDIGAYSTCTASPGGCALNPVEGSNTSVAIRVTANDTDVDCNESGVSNATLFLCTYTSSQGICNTTTYNYTWPITSIDRTGSVCTYTFAMNKTAADGTPAFFVPANDSYQLHVYLSSQAGRRTSDTERDRLWQYNLLKAILYPSLVTLGGGNPILGQWNNGTELALLTNWGNVLLSLDWNITDPTKITDTWILNGTDLELDDDNSHSTESSGVLSPIYMNGTQKNFYPFGGLGVCISFACNDPVINETLDTYYHAYPPLGLEAGTYNSTINIELN